MSVAYDLLSYGYVIIMPCILLVILILVNRCRVWFKRTAKELGRLSLDIRLDVESRKHDEAWKRKAFDIEAFKSEMESSISDEVREAVRKEIDFLIGSPTEESMIQKEELPIMQGALLKEPDVEFLPDTKSYGLTYLKKPEVSLNDMGIKRVSVNPDYWHKLNLLTYVDEEPLSVSAIVQNILTEHFEVHKLEITELAEKGRKNMKYGYGRY